MNGLIERYEELYAEMAEGKDTKKMISFGEAERAMFHKLAHKHPHLAEQWLTKLEAGSWHNYLSQTEAGEIVSALINQNGTRGGKWSREDVRSVAENMGGKIEQKPYYNSCALWATMNMLYSDHAKSAMEYVPKEDLPKFFFMQAIEKLTDSDRPKFVRDYFGV